MDFSLDRQALKDMAVWNQNQTISFVICMITAEINLYKMYSLGQIYALSSIIGR